MNENELIGFEYLQKNKIKGMKCDESKPYAFISYSHNEYDSQIVRNVFEILYSKGFNLWIDTSNMLFTADDWGNCATNALRNKNCKFVFYFRSESSMIKKSIADELSTANRLKHIDTIAVIDIWHNINNNAEKYYVEIMNDGDYKEYEACSTICHVVSVACKAIRLASNAENDISKLVDEMVDVLCEQGVVSSNDNTSIKALEVNSFDEQWYVPQDTIKPISEWGYAQKNEIRNMECDESKPYAFISYSHNEFDSQIVRNVFEILYSKGFNLWIDTANMPANEDDWQDSAMDALVNENCKLAFYFRSESSMLKETIAEELATIKMLAHINSIVVIDIWHDRNNNAEKFRDEILNNGKKNEYKACRTICSIVSVACKAIRLASNAENDISKLVDEMVDVLCEQGVVSSNDNTSIKALEVNSFDEQWYVPQDTIKPISEWGYAQKNEIRNMECDESKPYAFISYSHHEYDSQIVMNVFKALYNKGVNLWIDTANMPANEDDWQDSAMEALRNKNCKLAFYFRSESSMVKETIAEELATIKMLAHINSIVVIDIWKDRNNNAEKFRDEILNNGKKNEYKACRTICSIVSVACKAIRLASDTEDNISKLVDEMIDILYEHGVND